MESRRRLSAWTVSLTVHAAFLGIVVWIMQRPVPEPPVEPERLVYVEPAPPPPPPPAPAAPLTEPPRPPDPAPVERRLVEPKPTPKARPRRPEVPQQPPPTTPAGQAGGMAGGTPGGVVGGQIGGTPGGTGDTPVPAELVATPPVVVTRVAPDYPATARARGLQALVVLRAIVGRDGQVESDVAVIQSVAPFDEAAIAAIRRWRFTPGRDRDGRPVRVLLEVPVRFRLR